MAMGILAEALARIEHKLDLLLANQSPPFKPVHFYGNTCPLCSKKVDYVVDVYNNVVMRKCGCSTNKQPSSVPLTPVGEKNGNDKASSVKGPTNFNGGKEG